MSWLTEGMTEAEKADSIAAHRTRMSWGWYPSQRDRRNVLVYIERGTAPSTHTPFRKRDDGEWEVLANAYDLTYIDYDEVRHHVLDHLPRVLATVLDQSVQLRDGLILVDAQHLFFSLFCAVLVGACVLRYE